MKIKSNKIRCRKCNEIIESTNRHDFKFCSCRTVYVDGGLDYLKRGYKHTRDDYEELSDYEVECKECIYSWFDNDRCYCTLNKDDESGMGCFVER